MKNVNLKTTNYNINFKNMKLFQDNYDDELNTYKKTFEYIFDTEKELNQKNLKEFVTNSINDK